MWFNQAPAHKGSNMRKFIYPLISLLAFTLVSPSVFAQNANADLTIGTTIAAKCRIVGLNDVDFGAYASSANRDVSSYFYVQCSNRALNNAPVKVKISCGTNGTETGGVCTRSMTNQTDATSPNLNYSIFNNSGYNTAWNNNTQSFVVDTGNQITMQMFLRVPAGQQTPKKGSYLDQISVSLSF